MFHSFICPVRKLQTEHFYMHAHPPYMCGVNHLASCIIHMHLGWHVMPWDP